MNSLHPLSSIILIISITNAIILSKKKPVAKTIKCTATIASKVLFTREPVKYFQFLQITGINNFLVFSEDVGGSNFPHSKQECEKFI